MDNSGHCHGRCTNITEADVHKLGAGYYDNPNLGLLILLITFTVWRLETLQYKQKSILLIMPTGTSVGWGLGLGAKVGAENYRFLWVLNTGRGLSECDCVESGKIMS